MSTTNEQRKELKVMVSALAARILPEEAAKSLKIELIKQPEIAAVVLAIAQNFGKPELTRSLNLAKSDNADNVSLQLDIQGSRVSCYGQGIGYIKILFKSPLPGELQARLAIESAIDRFLEYLLKVHQIVVLEESDRHVQLFIPNQIDQSSLNFDDLWKQFLEQVALSTYGIQKYQLPGLSQTLIAMLKSVTLSGRGFSTLEIPILTQDQANVLAAWYFAVWRETKKRQDKRQQETITNLKNKLDQPELTEKERKTAIKHLQDAEAMQLKETVKYSENFQKFFGKLLEEHQTAYQELEILESKLNSKPSGIELKKLQKQQEKLTAKIVFSREFIEEKFELFKQVEGNPLDLVDRDRQQNGDEFAAIVSIAKNFDKAATDQIAGVKGDIFAQCIIQMYRLLEIKKKNQFDPLPPPLLTEQPSAHIRSPGDDNKEFCYSCGVTLNNKTAQWQVLRFIFERPSQRRQSASGEGRPHICDSCSALAFVSPLKLTDESIVVKLEPVRNRDEISSRFKDYLRMLTSKQLHLSAGKYIVLASDKTQSGDSAAQKLGQVQYALAKVASIFPAEVLTDFHFSLMVQSSESIPLASRHLIFIKGLMECYGQSIITSSKDFNLTLGDAIRYIQQDLPYLANYTITKAANTSNALELEKIRVLYWQVIQADLTLRGDSMDSGTQLSKRAKLYRDVASLTGLTCAFASSMERLLQAKDKDEREREISKLIEQVGDATSFCYYATLGVETTVQAKLWKNLDNYFIYQQTKDLLTTLGQADREVSDEAGKTWLQLYADDVGKAYTYFAENGYDNEKDWKELTYQLKLSLYTRFPELVRKLKSTGDK